MTEGPGRPDRRALPDGTVLRPQGPEGPQGPEETMLRPADGTVVRPHSPTEQTTLHPHGAADQTTLHPRSPTEQTTLHPHSPTEQTTLHPRSTADQTVLHPHGTADQTMLRPHGPVDGPVGQTVLHPQAPGASSGTVLRPQGPEQTMLRPADGTVARPSSPDQTMLRPEPVARRFEPDAAAWSATNLAPPPPGWIEHGSLAASVPEPGWTPRASGSSSSASNAFSPERGGRHIAPAPVLDVAVPKVRRGLPVDEPEGGRYARPETVAPKPRRSVTVRPWWVALAVVVVLAGAGGAFVWESRRPVRIDPGIGTVEASAGTGFTRGDDAVREYLSALAEGNIEKALSYGPRGGQGSEVLLQPAAIRASQADGRISNVNVPQTADQNASQIRASYTVGSQAVDAVFRVVKAENGNWRLAKTTTTVPLTAKRSERLPLVINSQAIPMTVKELEVVPGTYTLTTQLPFVGYLAGTRFTVLNLDYTAPIKELPAEITPDGKQALTQAAQESFAACLANQELSPPNCPYRLNATSPDQAPIPGTVKRRTNGGDPVPGAVWSVSLSDSAVAEAVVQVSITTDYTMRNNDVSAGTTQSGSWTMTADVTRTRWQDMTIGWRSG